MARTRRRATTKPGIDQQQGDEDEQQQQVDISSSQPQPQEEQELEPASSQAATERESVDGKDAQADHAEGPDDATANKSSGSALPDTTPLELSETPRRRRTRRAQEASGESAASQEQETAAAAAGSQSADADTAAEAAEAPAAVAAPIEPPRTPGGRRGRKSQQLAASRGTTTPRRPAAPETAAEAGEAEGSSVQQTPGTGRKRKRRAAEEVEQEVAKEEQEQAQEPTAPAASVESERREASGASAAQQPAAAEQATEQPQQQQQQQQQQQTTDKRKSWFGPRRSISAFFSRSSAPTPATDGPSRAAADAPDDSISIDEGEEGEDQRQAQQAPDQAQQEPQQEQQQPQALVTEEAPPTFSALANAADDISFSSLGEAITHGVAHLLPGADSGSNSAAPEASSGSSLERPASEAAAPAPQAPAQLQAPQQPPRQQKRGSLFSTFKDYRERIAGSFKRRRTEVAASPSSSSSSSSHAAQQEARAPAEPESSTPAENSAIETSALLESGESNVPTEQQPESTAQRLYPSLDGLRQETQARAGNLPLPPAASEETKSEEAPRLYPALPTFSFGQTPTGAPETKQEEENKDESGDVSMKGIEEEPRPAPAKAAAAPSEAGSSRSQPIAPAGAVSTSEQAAAAGPSSSKLTPPRKGPKPPSTMILGSGGKLARGARGRALQLVVEQELSQSQEQEHEKEQEQEQGQGQQERVVAMQADPEPAAEQPQADSADVAHAAAEGPEEEEARPDFIDFDTSRRLIARLDAGRSQPPEEQSPEQDAQDDSEEEGEEEEEQEEILINGSAARKDQETLPKEQEQVIEEQEDLGVPVSRGSPAPGTTDLATGTRGEPDNFGEIHFDDETGAVTFDAGEEAEQESEPAASELDDEKENSRDEADSPIGRSRSLSNSPRQPLTTIDLTDDNEEVEEDAEAAASPDVQEGEEEEEEDEIILLDARPPARKPSRTQLRGTMREALERDPDAYFGADLERSFDRSLRLDTSAIDLVAAIGAPVLYRQNASRVRKARHKSKRDPIFHKEHKLRVARERERTRVNFGARVAKTLKSLGAGTKLPPGFLQMIEKKIKVEHAIQRRGRASAPGDEEGGAAAMGDSSIERIIREMMARHKDASSSIGPSLVKQKEFERYKQAQLAKDRALRGVLGRKPVSSRRRVL